MGLAQLVRDAVQSGVAALDDIAESVTYSRVTGGAYAAGVPTPTTDAQLLAAIITGYSVEERRNEAIQPNDEKALITGIDWAAAFGANEPAVGDELTRANSAVLVVVAKKVDPAGAMWVLQMRRPG